MQRWGQRAVAPTGSGDMLRAGAPSLSCCQALTKALTEPNEKWPAMDFSEILHQTLSKRRNAGPRGSPERKGSDTRGFPRFIHMACRHSHGCPQGTLPRSLCQWSPKGWQEKHLNRFFSMHAGVQMCHRPRQGWHSDTILLEPNTLI